MSGIEDSHEAIAAVDPEFAAAADAMSETFAAFTAAATNNGITADLSRMVAAQLRVAADAFDGLTQRLEDLETTNEESTT